MSIETYRLEIREDESETGIDVDEDLIESRTPVELPVRRFDR